MNGKNKESLPGHWVVYRLGHLGDVVLTTGVLDRLARTRGWDFTFITRKAFEDIFSLNPCVTGVIPLESKDLSTPAFASLSRRLAAEYAGYGLLDLHGTLRSRILSAFWKGPVLRYDKKTMARRFFLASKGRMCGQPLLESTVPQRYYQAARMDGEPMPLARELLPRIWLSEKEGREARQKLDALFGENCAPVALHPFATHSLKAWPVRHWRELAALLNARAIPWFVLGRGEPLFPGKPNDFTNVTSLRQTGALLSWSRSLVSGDSGPMHLASATGAPVIALFGPTTREWGFYPAGPSDKVLEAPLACRPCSLHGRTACSREGECLSRISPEQVLQAVTSLSLPTSCDQAP